jgi:hypothetical protein
MALAPTQLCFKQGRMVRAGNADCILNPQPSPRRRAKYDSPRRKPGVFIATQPLAPAGGVRTVGASVRSHAGFHDKVPSNPLAFSAA